MSPLVLFFSTSYGRFGQEGLELTAFPKNNYSGTMGNVKAQNNYVFNRPLTLNDIKIYYKYGLLKDYFKDIYESER